MMQAESGAVGTVVDRRFVENMPLTGRTFQTLIGLAPGVVSTPGSASSPGQFSVNGQRSNANYLTVDGVSANIGTTASPNLGEISNGSLPGFGANGSTGNLVSADALQEFRIQTSSYAPEYGRTPGGQIAIITRSGTNQIVGSVSEYFRNDKLDANDWFANRNGLPHPALRQNYFGGVVGGPLMLPGYDGRNRTFFFLSYEGLELRLPQTVQANVPSSALLSQVGPQFQAVLGAFPKPNRPGGANGLGIFAASYSDPSASHTGAVRLDHNISTRVSVFLRYNESRSQASGRQASNLSNLFATDSETTTLTFGANATISPRLVESFRGNLSQNSMTSRYSLDSFGGATPFPLSLLFVDSADPASSQGFFSYLPGSIALTVGPQVANVPHQLNLVDDLTFQVGRHQLKFGVDYRRLRTDYSPYQLKEIYTINKLADLLSQTVSTGIIQSQPKIAPVFENISAYAQDTWRATPRLTLTYGFRWEFNPPPREVGGLQPVILNGLESPATTTVAPTGTPLYQTTYRNFAPRLGAAFRLHDSLRWATVIRGGGGIFYDLGSGQVSNIFTAYPFRLSKNYPGVPFPLTSSQVNAALTPSPNPPYTQLVEYIQDFKLPYTAGWNVAIEQGLGTDQTISVSYVASLARRLLGYQNYRLPIATTVLVVNNLATSDYHALQLQFRRRLSKGLQSTISYTWAHAIDNISDESDTVTQMSRASASFDVRQQFNGAVSWDLPSPRGRLLKPLTHWSLDSIFRVQTALPVNILSGLSTVIAQQSIFLRPNLVYGAPLYLSDGNAPGGRRINPGAFGPPPPGQQGDLARNAFRGLGISQADLSVRRQFQLSERWRLRFAVDAFNALNHPNFGLPDANLLSPTFGRATTMFGRSLGAGNGQGGLTPLYQIGGPRSLQCSVKILF